MLVTLSILFVTGGQVVAYVFGWILAQKEHGWRWMVGLGAVPAVIQFGLLLLLPETPRWLVKAGKIELARSVLRKMYSVNSTAAAEQILLDIKKEIIEEEATSNMFKHSNPETDTWQSLTQLQHRMTELLRVGGNRRALSIACLLQGLQQLCGFVRMHSPPHILQPLIIPAELDHVLLRHDLLSSRFQLANSYLPFRRPDQLRLHLNRLAHYRSSRPPVYPVALDSSDDWRAPSMLHLIPFPRRSRKGSGSGIAKADSCVQPLGNICRGLSGHLCLWLCHRPWEHCMAAKRAFPPFCTFVGFRTSDCNELGQQFHHRPHFLADDGIPNTKLDLRFVCRGLFSWMGHYMENLPRNERPGARGRSRSSQGWVGRKRELG